MNIKGHFTSSKISKTAVTLYFRGQFGDFHFYLVRQRAIIQTGYLKGFFKYIYGIMFAQFLNTG